MKTVTIRERPASLAGDGEGLAREGEILITRDAKPVAKLFGSSPRGTIDLGSIPSHTKRGSAGPPGARSRSGSMPTSPRSGPIQRQRHAGDDDVYLDTSCLLKRLVFEPRERRRPRCRRRRRRRGGLQPRTARGRGEAPWRLPRRPVRACQWKGYRGKLDDLLALAPFRECSLAGSVFRTALDQVRGADKTHCRSLDRLHLAAMRRSCA